MLQKIDAFALSGRASDYCGWCEGGVRSSDCRGCHRARDHRARVRWAIRRRRRGVPGRGRSPQPRRCRQPAAAVHRLVEHPGHAPRLLASRSVRDLAPVVHGPGADWRFRACTSRTPRSSSIVAVQFTTSGRRRRFDPSAVYPVPKRHPDTDGALVSPGYVHCRCHHRCSDKPSDVASDVAPDVAPDGYPYSSVEKPVWCSSQPLELQLLRRGHDQLHTNHLLQLFQLHRLVLKVDEGIHRGVSGRFLLALRWPATFLLVERR
jgi:hypothetical protein